ncbi:hypothetical protein BU15DRAFT_75744 [Melanogaster broomeanus]|nr:hypothetical protein BU15DRAFT_75744 [Melanogaster broomeanus]
MSSAVDPMATEIQWAYPHVLQLPLFNVSTRSWAGLHCTVARKSLGVPSLHPLPSNPPANMSSPFSVILGSLVTPIGMFWFAFLAHPDIHWFLPVLLGVPVGMGMTLIQLSLFNYLPNAIRPWGAVVQLSVHPECLLLAGMHQLYGFPTGLILLVYGKRLRIDVSHTAFCLDVVTPLLGQPPECTYGGMSTSTSSN